MPQQDKIKYFNFLLENDINFSRDESGNYVALVKVLNPAFYGKEANANKINQSFKQDQSMKENYNITNESKRVDSKLRFDTNKSGKNASKSVPKNIDKIQIGDCKGYKLDFSNFSGNKENSKNLSKKKPPKSKEQFEKEKRAVSCIKYLFYILILIIIFI